MAPPACISCRHYWRPRFYYPGAITDVCLRVAHADPVKGVRFEERSAQRDRTSSWFGFDRCGPTARYFEKMENEPRGNPPSNK